SAEERQIGTEVSGAPDAWSGGRSIGTSPSLIHFGWRDQPALLNSVRTPIHDPLRNPRLRAARGETINAWLHSSQALHSNWSLATGSAEGAGRRAPIQTIPTAGL